MSPIGPRVQRTVLLAPDRVARAVARRARRPEEAWLLRQPRRVRESYVREVLEGSRRHSDASEVWMLRQPRAVREAYVREVLDG